MSRRATQPPATQGGGGTQATSQGARAAARERAERDRQLRHSIRNMAKQAEGGWCGWWVVWGGGLASGQWGKTDKHKTTPCLFVHPPHLSPDERDEVVDLTTDKLQQMLTRLDGLQAQGE